MADESGLSKLLLLSALTCKCLSCGAAAASGCCNGLADSHSSSLGTVAATGEVIMQLGGCGAGGWGCVAVTSDVAVEVRRGRGTGHNHGLGAGGGSHLGAGRRRGGGLGAGAWRRGGAGAGGWGRRGAGAGAGTWAGDCRRGARNTLWGCRRAGAGSWGTALGTTLSRGKTRQHRGTDSQARHTDMYFACSTLAGAGHTVVAECMHNATHVVASGDATHVVANVLTCNTLSPR